MRETGARKPEAAEKPSLVNRRSVHRMYANAEALVLERTTQTTISCRLRDFTARGAKLVFDVPTAVPERFDLIIPALGDTYDAQRRWTSGCEIGIEFVGEYPRNQSPATLAPVNLNQRVQELETENAELRITVARLSRQLKEQGTGQIAEGFTSRLAAWLK